MTTPPESFDQLRPVMHEKFDELSPHLQRLASFALDDPNTFALETVVSIAGATGVQPSSLVRFAKAFGYSGFTEMQKVFRLRLIEGAASYRNDIYAERGKLERAAEDDPLAIFHEFTGASILALEQFRETVDGKSLKRAIHMMDAAAHIYVIGLRRAFPVAAYVAYGLTRLEYRCQLLDFVGGMVPQQVTTMTPKDLLIAISYAEYAPPVVDVVKDAHIRGIPVLTITDTLSSPLARNAAVCFTMNDADVHRFRPLAATMGLVQSLIIALGYLRDAREKSSAKRGRRQARP